ncbi:proteasome inhibitor PI31 subunit-like [Teleopsis dalmanni]|uniref:proteasome inhibitor PI31 subunit-like n=1 Tax=Teleopsis dalmanni TaxID=139649 RepID=UPI0018CD6C5D|nr:proteasome inhibitor PI31 subunit-like [Teleopsis dalmanni]XP_037945310.1 proteasome inhibitor PI31 subunit-like [Teleopsis dalmanni]XP_037945311.1 proteasome inhibitor PI31 subunit-like [Teleopsis dalmanni]
MAESISNQTNDSYFYGWNLFYNSIVGKVNKKGDVLIALAHFLLTKNFDFRCLGNGDKMSFSNEEVGSETLPNDWNQDETKYALRYLVHNKLYVLLGVISEESLIINLVVAQSKVVSNIMLEPNTVVNDIKLININELIPTATFICNRYEKELIDPVFKPPNKNTTSQQTNETPTSTNNSQPNNSQINTTDRRSIQPVHNPPILRNVGSRYPFNPLGVGRGDLDPLARGGPGSIMPLPFRPVQGPRFDPVNPVVPDVRPFPPNPNTNPNQNPNPDLFVPPGSNNNPNPDLFPPPGSNNNRRPDNFPPPDYYM